IINKNIIPLNGQPLISYTIIAALESKLISNTVVSTNSDLIKEISIKYGASVPFMRPESLSTDSASSIPTLQHAVDKMEYINNTVYDFVIMLQPTSPLRKSSDIDICINKLINTECDSVISVMDVDGYLPERMKYLLNDKLIDPSFCETYENQPRQEIRKMYIRNGAIYVCKRDVLMLENSFKGSDCRAYLMTKDCSVNIDTEDDLAYAQYLFQSIE
ncbi:MAG: acylneuraminate cytidylyltransferase family protein, partial [Flavobacteriales bacterium]|nr:acylneuraminate cytidylyltransferase family protein [Flavobacteriales bacterium]